MVATVLTACGIETFNNDSSGGDTAAIKLQQYLPLAVLKRFFILAIPDSILLASCNSTYRLRY